MVFILCYGLFILFGNCLVALYASVIEADRSCHVTVSSNPLHIMRSTSSNTLLGCGSNNQPWTLEAPAGQQINVSLLDFGLQQQERSRANQGCGHQHGYIVDKAAHKNVSICGVKEDRRGVIYQSVGNVIELVVQNQTVHGDGGSDESREVLFGFRGLLSEIALSSLCLLLS